MSADSLPKGDVILKNISVIIPCFNEIDTIALVITSVNLALREANFCFEIVVVDNGSTDGSDTVANNNKAKVIYSGATTVSGVRNMGVISSRGEILVFLDADIIVQPQWGQSLRSVYNCIVENDNFITGSHPHVPNNIRPLFFSWYKCISEDLRNTHLGSGHMIVSRKTFNKLGGFDENLVTGEDYDFCQRAKKNDVNVITNTELVVYHLGYPNNMIEFVKREIWHGRGDCITLSKFFSSKVSMSGVIFLLLNLLLLPALFYDVKFFFGIILALLVMAITVNLYKFGIGDYRSLFNRSIVAYVYLLSRGLSLLVSFSNSIRS